MRRKALDLRPVVTFAQWHLIQGVPAEEVLAKVYDRSEFIDITRDAKLQALKIARENIIAMRALQQGNTSVCRDVNGKWVQCDPAERSRRAKERPS